MLKIPAKYSRCGIKIKCLKCKWQLPGAGICHLTGKSLSSCAHKNLHRYQLLVCIPHTKGGRRTKVLETTNFDTALVEMQKFREELRINGYHKAMPAKNRVSDTTVLNLATSYLDAISGVNTPEFLNRQRSKEHISDSKLAIKRFCIALKKKGYNMEILDVKDVGDEEVGIFYEFIKDTLGLGTRSVNKSIGILKTFWNFIIRVKDVQITNPFTHVELRSESKGDATIISKNEFTKLLKSITPENGVENSVVNGKNKVRYHYHRWLKAAFKLALETGLRREELFSLKWSNLAELQKGVLVLRVMNFKVNRILTGDGNGRSVKHVPVTKSLMEVLNKLGYTAKKDTDGFIIERPEGTEVGYLKNILSRSFAHYIKLATDRKIEFKDLRKTYITHLTVALGPNAKMFTGHTNDQVLKNHYLSSAFLAANIGDFRIF